MNTTEQHKADAQAYAKLARMEARNGRMDRAQSYESKAYDSARQAKAGQTDQ